MSLSFGNKVIFEQASIHINHGDQIGLIGPNGKGKSSLFKVLLGDLTPDKTVPAFIFDKSKNDKSEELAYSVFLVPQQFEYNEARPETVKEYFFHLFPVLKDIHTKLEKINHKLVSEESAELLEQQHLLMEQFEHLKGWETINKYNSYLKYFGIEDFETTVDKLSGGEKRKILLSLGLCSPANLILWDEPTNHLDIETIKLFEEELLLLRKTFIIISHDRYLLSRTVNKIFHINSGIIEEFKGDYSNYLSFLAEKEQARVKQLEKLKNSLKRETDWMRQGIKARGTRSKKRVESYHKLASNVQSLKEQARKTVSMELGASQKKSKKLLELKNVSLSFKDKNIFEDLSATLFKGQRIGLVGPNGSGKTSFVKMIAEDLLPNLGTIKKADELTINYFSQNRDELDMSMTPFELLGNGQDHVYFEDGRKQHVIGYFQNFLFSKDEVHRPLSTFSGGEIARLQLASQLMKFSDLWIFDEPTNDLDIETIEILEQKLTDFNGSVILISHDRTFLENVTDTVWIIEDKKLQVFQGGYAQAAPYIEAMYLEHELQNQQDKAEEPTPVIEEIAPKAKSSQISKKELKLINDQIAEKEKLIEDLDKLMSQFDFSTNDPEKAKLYKQLSEKKDSTEEDLLELYEKQGELENL